MENIITNKSDKKVKFNKIWFLALVIILLVLARGAYLLSQKETSINEAEKSFETFAFDNIFSLEYPIDFKLDSGFGLGGGYLDTSIVKISVPENFFKATSTNYVESYLLISRSNESQMLGNCLAFTDLPDPVLTRAVQTKIIDGVSFKNVETVGAAAGNLYENRLYRTIKDDFCYEAVLTIHTANIGNYPEGTTVEFNRVLAYNVLEQIFSTFHFINN